MNGEVYLNMINDCVVPDMRITFQYDLFGDVAFPNNWWFQDGAGAHRLRAVTVRLRELFGDQVVSLYHDREWPARSPDLTPCDYFLWGYVKSRVFLYHYR